MKYKLLVKIVVFSFALFICAHRSFSQVDNLLKKKVLALPSNSQTNALKKYTLLWALTEAEIKKRIGQPTDAQELLNDVEIMLDKNIGNKLAAPSNLFPNIPDFNSNPIAEVAVIQTKKILGAGLDTILSSPFNSPQGVADFNNKIGPRGLLLAQAFCHPQSPFAGDPTLLPFLFHTFEVMYSYHQQNSKYLADFGHSPMMTEMYLLVNTVYPDLILPSRKRKWEQSLRLNTEAIMAKHADTYHALIPNSAYPNADVKYINALVYASMVFNEPKYYNTAISGERLMSTAIYPDGGWAYIGQQNENYTYHSIDITETCRLYQVTGDSVAFNNIKASRWYFPLSIEPPGVAEYYTAPSWKHYWNRAKDREAAFMVASLLNDGYNYAVANFDIGDNNDFALASYYKNDLKVRPLADNYILYDRNIQGPRARFGTFSFAGTSRNMPKEDRGKSTFVGAMLLYQPGHIPRGINANYPLYVALDKVTTEVSYLQGNKSNAFMARNETNVVTVSDKAAALTSSYTIAPYHGAVTNFSGTQAWIFTPKRLVGLVNARATEPTDNCDLNGFVDLLYPQPKNHTPSSILKIDDSTFRYGGIFVKFHKFNYRKISFAYNIDRACSGRLELTDSVTNIKPSQHYAKNESRFFLVEIYPETSLKANTIETYTTNDSLVVITLKDDNGAYQLIYNPTASDGNFNPEFGYGINQWFVHPTGEAYRPDWLGGSKITSALIYNKTSNARKPILIKAGEHVLLTNN